MRPTQRSMTARPRNNSLVGECRNRRHFMESDQDQSIAQRCCDGKENTQSWKKYVHSSLSCTCCVCYVDCEDFVSSTSRHLGVVGRAFCWNNTLNLFRRTIYDTVIINRELCLILFFFRLPPAFKHFGGIRHYTLFMANYDLQVMYINVGVMKTETRLAYDDTGK